MTTDRIVKRARAAYVGGMRLTKGQTDQNRQAILAAAERLFREHGIDGVGVADLMKAAGFTHGGFYNHFASKEALAAEACGAALARASDALEAHLAGGKTRPWKQYVEQYLSVEHRDDPATGCTLGALAGDAARQGAHVQAQFAGAVERVIEILAAYLARVAGDAGERPAALRERAVQLWSEIIGGLVLARAVAEGDPALSDEILAANRHKLLR
jgi:TetR/AcrR family transcriptional repressor of nem operon